MRLGAAGQDYGELVAAVATGDRSRRKRRSDDVTDGTDSFCPSQVAVFNGPTTRRMAMRRSAADSAHHRHGDVEDEQIRVDAFGLGHDRSAVTDSGHHIELAREHLHEVVEHCLVIVVDQDAEPLQWARKRKGRRGRTHVTRPLA